MSESSKVINSPGSAPFISPTVAVGQVMRRVIYALLPGLLAYLWFFGWGPLTNLVYAVASALCFEALLLGIRQRPLWPFLSDGSAVLTAFLLALSLPPMAPWWLPVLGCFIAIVFAKQLYGGLGYNPVNPAMAAYAVLLISFPLEMSQWIAPLELQQHSLDLVDSFRYTLTGRLPTGLAFDTISSATPLDKLRTDTGLGLAVSEIRNAPVFGLVAGRGSEWVGLGYLLGGLALLWLRIISWHIPVSMLLALGLMAAAGFLIDPLQQADPLMQLFGGASMLGAFFIATDPVTAATTARGKLIYGAGIGVLVYAIRTWGSYPDGVAFAVLLMGMTVPLLDQYTVPRVFGARRRGWRE